MAGRTVRRVKRGRVKESANSTSLLPAIIVTPPDGVEGMKIKVPERSTEVKNAERALNNDILNAAVTRADIDNMTDFNVRQLIAQLSENSRASKEEIENIQRRLLQQANEIMKVNTFANSRPVEPRVIAATQKYGSTVYGRLPVAPRNVAINDTPNPDRDQLSQSTDTQLVPERLQERTDNASAVNSDRGNVAVRRVGASDAGRIFFRETSSALRAAASARAATTRGECLCRCIEAFSKVLASNNYSVHRKRSRRTGPTVLLIWCQHLRLQYASVIVSYASAPDAIVIVTVVRSGSLFETDCPVCVLAYLHPPRSIATSYSLSYNRNRLG